MDNRQWLINGNPKGRPPFEASDFKLGADQWQISWQRSLQECAWSTSASILHKKGKWKISATPLRLKWGR